MQGMDLVLLLLLLEIVDTLIFLINNDNNVSRTHHYVTNVTTVVIQNKYLLYITTKLGYTMGQTLLRNGSPSPSAGSGP